MLGLQEAAEASLGAAGWVSEGRRVRGSFQHHAFKWVLPSGGARGEKPCFAVAEVRHSSVRRRALGAGLDADVFVLRVLFAPCPVSEQGSWQEVLLLPAMLEAAAAVAGAAPEGQGVWGARAAVCRRDSSPVRVFWQRVRLLRGCGRARGGACDPSQPGWFRVAGEHPSCLLGL